ncbi:MAG: phosphonoacetaldehyde hydrolase [Planctomycetales bacterium]|nr:phosphonoacetaldehyde hydrolase [Planctomycetales bacterium]
MSNLISRRPYRGSLRAVIFDWAGTIVDFGSRAPVLAVQQAFDSLGVPVTTDEVRGPMGMAKRAHLQAMLEVPRIATAWQAARGAQPNDAAVDEVYGQFLEMQSDLLLAHSEFIPGAVEAIAACRRRGLKIGSSTGYTRELLAPLVDAANEIGVTFDAVLCASDVSVGRPAPWLCFENARRMDVYPMAAIVKVDDTTVGVEAGVNAGAWAVGVAASGNLVGLSRDELAALTDDDRAGRVAAARAALFEAGAHLVVDTVADLPDALGAIETALAQGERP